MTVRNRGVNGGKKRWYYDFMIRGVRYKGAIPEARTKDDAEKAENKIKKDAYDGKYGKFAGDYSFSEFAKGTYLDWAKLNKRWWYTDKLIVKSLCRFFDKKTFQEMTPLLIEKYKKHRRESLTRSKKARSPATVNRELAVLSKIFSLAIDDEIIETNPCSRVKRFRLNNERVRYLTHEEEVRLMNELADYPLLKNIVTMAIYTGFRRGEIFRLKWSEVDFSLKVVRTLDKNGKPKVVPMANKLFEILKSLPKETEFVFPSPKTDQPLTDVKKGFKTARENAGIENFRFHDLRHTTATRLAENGVDAFTIAEILGHSDLRMTKRYTHSTSKSKRRAIDSLEAASENCPKFVPNENRQAGGLPKPLKTLVEMRRVELLTSALRMKNSLFVRCAETTVNTGQYLILAGIRHTQITAFRTKKEPESYQNPTTNLFDSSNDAMGSLSSACGKSRRKFFEYYALKLPQKQAAPNSPIFTDMPEKTAKQKRKTYYLNSPVELIDIDKISTDKSEKQLADDSSDDDGIVKRSVRLYDYDEEAPPLLVFRHKTLPDCYSLLEGYKRMEGARENVSVKQLPCIIVDAKNLAEARLILASYLGSFRQPDLAHLQKRGL